MEREDILKLAEADPETAEALKFAPQMPADMDIQFWRQMEVERRAKVFAALGPAPTGITEQDHKVKMRDGHSITIRSYTPNKSPEGGSPLILIYHGGGFCLGGLDTETLNCRNFALQLGAVVLNVEYRLAPEHPFPIPANDAYDSFKWAAENASALKARTSAGFIVAGASAGGNLASVIAHLARNEKVSPHLTGQYLSVPVLIPHENVPEKYKDEYLSREQNSGRGVLPKALMEMFEQNYNADIQSPLFATFNDISGHADLPPVYFQICGADPYRDDAIIYERVLREQYNIPTRVDMYKGLPHMFWQIMPSLRQSMQWKDDSVEGVRWLLEQKKGTFQTL